MFTRRHLPHWIPEDANVFVTWRLAGAVELTGDKRRSPVPPWLQASRIAFVVANAILYGRKDYDLLAWVIVPNHCHMIVRPHRELSAIMRWLKGWTARVANRILNRTGLPFWQDESFDHWVRTDEFAYLIDYIENNPVKAGLVPSKEQWPWSSASASGTGDRLSSPVNSR